ncbi:MAG TPA: histidine kinase [Thermomicrobiaceae bacterium]|nr:histidine kinase [Thermomicrobiaceae bacterium]
MKRLAQVQAAHGTHDWWVRALIMYVWLAALGLMVPGIASGVDRPAWLAVAALAAFAALYVATTWVAAGDPRRRGWRDAALAALALVTIAAALRFSEVWLLLFMFLAAAVAVSLPGNWPIAGVILTTAATGLVILAKPIGAATATGWLIGPFFGGMFNIYLRRTRELIHELRASRAELARLAVEEERLRFARDLHDLLGHTLSLIVVKAEVVRRLAERDPALAASQAGDIEAIGRQALAEVREVVTGYRQPGLADELASARAALADAGIEMTASVDDLALPPQIDTLFGWVLREGVTNVIRHSGASCCMVTVSRDGERAALAVRDDGRHALSPPSRGSGLRGLAERVAAAGGRVDAGPDPAGGFRLSVVVPIEAKRGQLVEQGA